MIATLERLWGTGKSERAFDALERERLETDLVTEASERLRAPMDNVFNYSYERGDFHFQGQPLRPIFDNGIRVAAELVKTKPEFALELQRRLIERHQLDEQIELMQNIDWSDPLVLVHISPTPDAVLEKGVDLNAYDTERKKIMVRITEPTIDGVQVTSLSLDGNDRAALRVVGSFFGTEIPDDASSEDILGMHFVASKSQFSGERPAKILRELYDTTMQKQYGGEWFAGRRDSDTTTTMQKIRRFPRLVDQHVEEVMSLKKRLGANFRFTKEYETAAYNFLAAIEQSYKTGVVVTQMASAGAAAQASGVAFSRPDCPTGSIETAEQALSQQGIGEKAHHWHYGTCQACQDEKLVGECDVCMDCEKADNRGEDLMAIRKAALARLALASTQKEETQSGNKRSEMVEHGRDIFTDEYIRNLGTNVHLHYRVTVGDKVPEVVDDFGTLLVADLRAMTRGELALAS